MNAVERAIDNADRALQKLADDLRQAHKSWDRTTDQFYAHEQTIGELRHELAVTKDKLAAAEAELKAKEVA